MVTNSGWPAALPDRSLGALGKRGMEGAAVQIYTTCKMEHSLMGGLSNESEVFYSVQNGTQSYGGLSNESEGFYSVQNGTHSYRRAKR